ncbi:MULTISPECIES: hypothetical protein [unclassified Corynebacterium]|uniref:hypothetical protein n=1 Tax=unclassified Corynebacterium TaxID=2624378 RepID=UPI0030AC45E9
MTGTGKDSGENPDHFIDPHDDPLVRLEKEEYSFKPAIKFTLSVIAATLVTALVIGIAGAISGGPACDAGKTTFLCSRTWELAFPLIPGLVALIGCIWGFWITYIQWKSFKNWRAWLAMCWVLMPFTLLWMVSTFGIAILGID